MLERLPPSSEDESEGQGGDNKYREVLRLAQEKKRNRLNIDDDYRPIQRPRDTPPREA